MNQYYLISFKYSKQETCWNSLENNNKAVILTFALTDMTKKYKENTIIELAIYGSKFDLIWSWEDE